MRMNESIIATPGGGPSLSQRSGAVRLTLLTLAVVVLTLVFLVWSRNLAVR